MFGYPNINAANHICGLYFTTQGYTRTYLPQVELVSHTTINPVCFTTSLTQTFRNVNSDVLPQVRYTFPLYDGVAVNSYIIKYGGKTLKGVVKQKDVAKQEYQAAVDRGETAGLLESLPAGVFGVTLGNVPANADIIVDVTYCGELKHDAAIDGLRYMLPTSIAPRYGEYPGEVAQSNAIAKKGITIRVEMDMGSSAIRRVQSPSHPIAVSMGGLLDSSGEPSTTGDFKPFQAAATLALGTTELGGDFILQILIDDISKPQAILEAHPTIPNQRAIMATLVPKFVLEPAHPEIVFIADQSGSMSNQKNKALVSALKVFLKSLPLGVRFNICAFGNSFRFLWPKSQAYNESNLNAAVAFVDSFNASYGGTEILNPIKATFEQRLKDLPLEVMLLTDGEVWGEHSLFAYINEQIRDKAVDARVFTLGIGNDVSHTLVEGVARAGNGFAQFVSQNEDTDQKVIRMLKGALYAHTTEYELEVHHAEDKYDGMTDDEEFEIVEKVNDCLSITTQPPAVPAKESTQQTAAPKSFFDSSAQPDKASKKPADRYAHLPVINTPKLLQAPHDIPPLFPFNRTTVYLLLGPESAQKPVVSVTLRAKSAEGPLELNIPVAQDTTNDSHDSIHHLAARKAVQDLEEGRGWLQAAKLTDGTLVKTKHDSRFDELVEREGVQLGEKFQITSKWTSFVAIENSSQNQGEEDDDGEDDDDTDPEVVARFEAHEQKLRSEISAKRMKKKRASPRGKAVAGQSTDSCTTAATGPNVAQPLGMAIPSAYFAARGSAHPPAPPRAAPAGSAFPPSPPRGPYNPQYAHAMQMQQHGPVMQMQSQYSPSGASFGVSHTSRGGGLFGARGSAQPPPPPSSGFAPPPPPARAPPAPSYIPGNSYGAGSFAHASSDPDTPALTPANKFAGGPGIGNTESEDEELYGSDAEEEPREAFKLFDKPAKDGGDLFGSAPGFSESEAKAEGERVEVRMRALIGLQTFSGAWKWSEELFKTLQLDVNKVSTSSILVFGSGDVETDKNACATAIALAWLEAKVGEKKDVWEMVASKGRDWLCEFLSDTVAGKGARYRQEEVEETVRKAREVVGDVGQL